MPTSATDSSASPRRANAGPEITGDTAVTPRQRVQHVAHLLPVVDRAQALGALVFQHQLHAAVGGRQDAVGFLGGLHLDVRLRAQRAVDDVALQAGDQRGEEHDHRHAHRDADQDQRALRLALAQEPGGDGPLDPHRRQSNLAGSSLRVAASAASAGRPLATTRTRSPSATVACASARIQSPACRPGRDLGHGVSPRRPSCTWRRVARPSATTPQRGAVAVHRAQRIVGHHQRALAAAGFHVDRDGHVLAQERRAPASP